VVPDAPTARDIRRSDVERDQRTPRGLSPEWLAQLRQEIRIQAKAQRGTNAGEPTVNVTIGSIEVRAAPAEPARQPSAEHAPSGIMTLDEYLKRRDGEGS
jgi:hypothetical protein